MDWHLSWRQASDLELIRNGGFAPVDRFLGYDDYQTVLTDMRLGDGTVWPVPVMLDLPERKTGTVDLWRRGAMVARVHIDETWQPDLQAEAQAVYGTDDPAHPGVAYLADQTHGWYVSGQVEWAEPIVHHDWAEYRLTPAQVRERLAGRPTVAFQTRNPMHRAHIEMCRRAADQIGHLLLHPVVGPTRPGDIDYHTRIRAIVATLGEYRSPQVTLGLLPLAMRMAGPREAVWHALIRRNFGATHLIVGRDHAGPGSRPDGQPWYGPYDAQQLLGELADEIGVTPVPFRQMVCYFDDRYGYHYVPEDELPDGLEPRSISGTELRVRLEKGETIPEWFTPAPVANILHQAYPPRLERGFCLFLTGLSGAGKTTIAEGIADRLRAHGGRPVTVLDGDEVRTHLSAGLGFSKEDRDTNIRRIGWVASQLVRHGGAVICAPIAPYDQTRRQVRQLVEPYGGFHLVHVATSLEECERRDVKGLYAQARSGRLKGFTGIDDPYEEPADAELTVDTEGETSAGSVATVWEYLMAEGWI